MLFGSKRGRSLSAAPDSESPLTEFVIEMSQMSQEFLKKGLPTKEGLVSTRTVDACVLLFFLFSAWRVSPRRRTGAEETVRRGAVGWAHVGERGALPVKMNLVLVEPSRLQDRKKAFRAG